MGTIANAKVTHYYNCYNGDFIGCLRCFDKFEFLGSLLHLLAGTLDSLFHLWFGHVLNHRIGSNANLFRLDVGF